MARVIKCTIEMELIEGEHFNYPNYNLTDENAIKSASRSFLDMINNIDNSGDLEDYVQAKIIEDVS